jgi:hypothetical protein
VLVVAVVSGALTWLAAASRELTVTGRAQAAADVVALVAATDGSVAAERVAADNGAVVLSIADDGATVAVRIRLEDRTATAHAAPDVPEFARAPTTEGTG